MQLPDLQVCDHSTYSNRETAYAAGNRPYSTLLALLRLEIRAQGDRPRRRSSNGVITQQTGLSKPEQENLAATMFGRETSSANRTDAQNQFLKSHMEMAYPQHGEHRLPLFMVYDCDFVICADEVGLEAIAEDEAAAAKYGGHPTRDYLGLPSNVGGVSHYAKVGMPPEVLRAINASGSRHQTNQAQRPEREHISAPMAITTPNVPPGVKPPARRHSCTGYADQVMENVRQRQPRFAPNFRPENPSDPVQIEGMEPAEYAAAQPYVPSAHEQTGQPLQRMELQSELTSELDKEKEKENRAYREAFTDTARAWRTKMERFGLLAPASGESSSSASHASSRFPPGVPVQEQDQSASASQADALPSLQWHTVLGVSKPQPLTEQEEIEQAEANEQQPVPRRPMLQREDSALPPDFFTSESEIILRRRERDSPDPWDDPSPASMEQDWHERLP